MNKLYLGIAATLLLLAGCDGGESSNDQAGAAGSSDSTGGSRARMTLIGDYLYTIAGSDVQLMDVSTPEAPNFWNRTRLAWDIETLFPYGDYLLVGSETGVHIMDNSTVGSPQVLSKFVHARSCDPVVAANDIGYVTLNAEARCWSETASSQLDVLDLTDMSNPTLIKTYPMQEPTGLAVSGQWLFICDGRAGLKVFNNTDPLNLSVEDTLPDVNCFDLIAKDDTLYISTSDKLLQYDYSSVPLTLISEYQVGI